MRINRTLLAALALAGIAVLTPGGVVMMAHGAALTDHGRQRDGGPVMPGPTDPNGPAR